MEGSSSSVSNNQVELPTIPPIPLELVCKWRGWHLEGDRYACTSPKLKAPNGVSVSAHCATCYCRDHGPVTPIPVNKHRKIKVNPVASPYVNTNPIKGNRFRLDCIHRGEQSRSLREGCGRCNVFQCQVHKECLPLPRSDIPEANGIQTCQGCKDYVSKSAKSENPPIAQRVNQSAKPSTKSLKWAYGVTTVLERVDHHLPRTLNSLSYAGFGNPRLFVDGGTEAYYQHFGLQATIRVEKVKAYANWILALVELFYRNPDAQRFAIFQDDIVLSKNVRQYLDSITFPQKGYLNLTTIWESQDIVGEQCPLGITPAAPQRLNNGQPKKPNALGVIPQHGRGAMALVFDRDGVLTLLRHPHITNRVIPDRPGYDPNRCYRLIDGAVIEAMNNAGYTEYVHNPSLVNHSGTHSTITGRKWGPKALSKSFRGEDFDCLSLLPSTESVTV